MLELFLLFLCLFQTCKFFGRSIQFIFMLFTKQTSCHIFQGQMSSKHGGRANRKEAKGQTTEKLHRGNFQKGYIHYIVFPIKSIQLSMMSLVVGVCGSVCLAVKSHLPRSWYLVSSVTRQFICKLFIFPDILQMDKDGNGTISLTEYFAIFEEHGIKVNQSETNR